MKQLPNPSRIACLFAAVLISLAALFSCSQYDDTELRNSLTDLEERIADLEEAVRAEQDNINALNELINRIESGRKNYSEVIGLLMSVRAGKQR